MAQRAVFFIRDKTKSGCSCRNTRQSCSVVLGIPAVGIGGKMRGVIGEGAQVVGAEYLFDCVIGR